MRISVAFREICTSHELSERDVVEQDVPVVNIEMFLFNFPKVGSSWCCSADNHKNCLQPLIKASLENVLQMLCIHLFPHLHTLMISQQVRR